MEGKNMGYAGRQNFYEGAIRKMVTQALEAQEAAFKTEHESDTDEQLHSAKSSDNSRLILALTAIGKDVTNVEGHNLLQGLSDMDYIRKQGINGPIWALLAFDSGNYPIPAGNVSREALIEVILEAQLADGGWALSGERSDPDMTGMAIQVLAPYIESRLDVKKAVEAAVWTLSKMQNDNGSFTSVDGPNSESVAQVIVALAAVSAMCWRAIWMACPPSRLTTHWLPTTVCFRRRTSCMT